MNLLFRKDRQMTIALDHALVALPRTAMASSRISWLCSIAAAAAMTLAGNAMAAEAPLPKLQANGSAIQLMVDGKPWIALGGEVHNSTASSAAYMAPVWDRLAALHLNTVVTPAYWELSEPEEGRFDFSLVDDQIRQARARNLRIVLLWFGSLKNAKSTYAPAWVRADQTRFPRAVARPSPSPFAKGDKPLSVFGDATVAADARAFARLMDHLARNDPEHTVIAVQVENETGLLGDSRDRSPAAEAAWNGPVPPALIDHLLRNKGHLEPALDALWSRGGYRRTGTWAQVFGTAWQAEELFMAWGVSRLVDTVAAAGKARLALPMYANAWLGPQKPTDAAGAYPSGGPVPRVFDVWRAGAPHLDWLSPDIYVDDFETWAAAYARADNPLFVPEARFVVGNLFEALGRHRAIGFSPFGIEDGLPDSQIAEAYALLGEVRPLIAEAQARGNIAGFALKPGETPRFTLGDYVLTVRSQSETLRKTLLDIGVSLPADAPERRPQTNGSHGVELTDTRPSGLAVRLGADEFLIVGRDLDVSFAARATPEVSAEFATIEEGRYADGRWVAGRTINGDERLSILPADRFGMVRIRLIRPRR
jgi:hypothetical protein